MRETVESSNVHAVAWADNRLEVEFKEDRSGTRAVYFYEPVESAAFEAMKRPGASVGRLVNALKRNPSIVCRKVAYVDLSGEEHEL